MAFLLYFLGKFKVGGNLESRPERLIDGTFARIYAVDAFDNLSCMLGSLK